MNKKIYFIIGMLLVFQAGAWAATFQSTARQVTLLELYTSEGCSSCPPAEEWMSTLRKPALLWKNYVPVAFHVDYWDGSGWKDPFGSPEFTQRQKQYTRVWRGSSLYTPCVVMAGRAWSSWRRIQVLPIFNVNVGVLKVETQGAGRYRAVFQPTDTSLKSYDIHLALLGFEVESRVTRGENSGKVLRHDFVVLDYAHTAMGGTSEPSAALNLNPHDSRAKKMGIAAWVTQSGHPEPIQATGGYLD